METIRQAAIKYEGNNYTLAKPARHADIKQHMIVSLELEPFAVGEVYGYLTSTWRFVDRREAGEIALRSGQVDELLGDRLYTNDLW